MISGVHHFCITVSDMEKSLEFYRDKLGMREKMNLKFDADPVMMDLQGTEPKQHLVMLSAGDVNVELIQYVQPKGKPDPRKTCDFGPSHVCFRVDDINRAYKEMKAKGVDTFHRPPDFIDESGGPLSGYGYVYFRGPDNEIVEFMEVPSSEKKARQTHVG